MIYWTLWHSPRGNLINSSNKTQTNLFHYRAENTKLSPFSDLCQINEFQKDGSCHFYLKLCGTTTGLVCQDGEKLAFCIKAWKFTERFRMYSLGDFLKRDSNKTNFPLLMDALTVHIPILGRKFTQQCPLKTTIPPLIQVLAQSCLFELLNCITMSSSRGQYFHPQSIK